MSARVSAGEQKRKNNKAKEPLKCFEEEKLNIKKNPLEKTQVGPSVFIPEHKVRPLREANNSLKTSFLVLFIGLFIFIFSYELLISEGAEIRRAKNTLKEIQKIENKINLLENDKEEVGKRYIGQLEALKEKGILLITSK